MPSTDIATRERVELREPPLYRVIYKNDDVTTVDFVIQSLVEFFNYSFEASTKITQDVHEQGSATVAVLPHEIAEQKKVEVTLCARTQGFPLEVQLERDD